LETPQAIRLAFSFRRGSRYATINTFRGTRRPPPIRRMVRSAPPSFRRASRRHRPLFPNPPFDIRQQRLPGEKPMFHFQDLFQWDRFITPTVIKSFYWLVIILIGLFGISGVFSALTYMAVSPFGGFIVLLSALAGIVVGIIFSRIAAELILIVFRINEHLGAIRDQGRDLGRDAGHERQF
jgi:hypothetical protein